MAGREKDSLSLWERAGVRGVKDPPVYDRHGTCIAKAALSTKR
jgi:hypothetical protein